ncbi:hypothetical protein [Burkholderia anthina]|uniref:hypothetical protein n=1 Tax=Burkholderia anthina TaxID=179879 RepID=UPI00158AC43F|nr:hypothetical protein [Burkholderia anthina]
MSPIALQVKTDFKAYWDAAEKGRMADSTRQRPLIASAHKFAICFSQLSRAMGVLPAHRRIFLQEIASDAIHLVHVLVGGDARGARFYLRSVIENFWRHHYFRDHPVEYGWLHTRSKYFLEMKTLREHCGWLDCFQGKINPLFGDLSRLYGELSTAVHSTSSKTLVLRQALDDIRLTVEQSTEVSRDLLATMKACLVLCLFSEHEIYLGLHVNVQEFLNGVLSAKQREWLAADLAKVE